MKTGNWRVVMLIDGTDTEGKATYQQTNDPHQFSLQSTLIYFYAKALTIAFMVLVVDI